MTLESSLAIIRKSDKILFSLRSKNPFFHHYEFPGGKVEDNESPEDALERECFEELGIRLLNIRKIGSLVHCYKNKSIKLHIYEINQYEGKIFPKENQKLSFLSTNNSNEKFIESTYRIINYMSLPRYMQITPEDIINILDDKIYKKSNINMIRFRSKNISPNDYIKKARAYSMICIKNDIKLILDAKYYEYYQDLKYSGIHYTSEELEYLDNNVSTKSNKFLMYSASCHDIKEINMANRLNLDFIILSPVLASKYNSDPIGWNKFKKLSLEANMPVFALGGISQSDLDICLLNNGYGISGIKDF